MSLVAGIVSGQASLTNHCYGKIRYWEKLSSKVNLACKVYTVPYSSVNGEKLIIEELRSIWLSSSSEQYTE